MDKINIFKAIETGFLGLSLLIDSVVYELVTKVFDLFIILANASVFENDIINDIMYKCYALVGIIMLFVLVFAVIQNIFNPENAFSGDKGMGKIVTNIIKALILVALVPVIFDLGYNLQNAIITDNIFGKMFFGADTSYSTIEIQEKSYNEEGEQIAEGDSESLQITGRDELTLKGNQLAFYVYNGFINPEGLDHYKFNAGDYEAEVEGWSFLTLVSCVGAVGATAGAIISAPSGIGPVTLGLGAKFLWASCAAGFVTTAAVEVANLWTLQEYTWQKAVVRAQAGDFKGFVPFAETIADGDMTYMPIISSIIGLVLLYIIFSFCLDLGVRAVKLAFYEMIAPIPILLSTLPGKDDLLKNWSKAVLATFMEVIIRLLIIYLIVYFAGNIKLNIEGEALIQAIIIMGIVVFAKQLPKLISDITGIDSGNLKLGIKEKLADGGLFAAGAALGSSATAGIRNFAADWKKNKSIGSALRSGIGGAGAGLIRGGKAGLKAKSFSEMRQSAGAGAAATTAAKDRRDARKLRKKSQLNQAQTAFKAGNYKEAAGILTRDTRDAVTTFVAGGFERFKGEQELYQKIQGGDDTIDKLASELLERDAIAGSNTLVQNVSGYDMSLIAMKNLLKMEKPQVPIKYDANGNEMERPSFKVRNFDGSEKIINNDADWANYKAKLTTEYNKVERNIKAHLKRRSFQGAEGIKELEHEIGGDLGNGERNRLNNMHSQKENIQNIISENQDGINKLNQELEKSFIERLTRDMPNITESQMATELADFRQTALVNEITEGTAGWDNLDQLVNNIKDRQIHMNTEVERLKRQSERKGGNSQK